MKKLYTTDVEFKSKLAKKRHMKNLARKGVERKIRPGRKTHVQKREKTIVAPEAICLYSPDQPDFVETIKFFESIERKFSSKCRVIDFSRTREVTAAAMTMLYAILEKAKGREKFKGKVIWPKHKEVEGMLKKSFIGKIVYGSNNSLEIKSTEILPVISSIENNLVDEICEHIMDKFYRDDLNDKEYAHIDYVLGSAVSETVDNVCTHAYPTLKSEEKKWWLCCEVADETLYLAIYDSGVGIPKTVHTKEWFTEAAKREWPEIYEEVKKIKSESPLSKKLLSSFSDAQLIYISMLDDFSETKLKKHGQGSKSIKSLVGNTDNGKLWIFSGDGLYLFKDYDTTPELIRLPKSVSGTLIQWNIKIS